jgi:hypothetical protein
MRSDTLQNVCKKLSKKKKFRDTIRAMPDCYIFNFLISQFHYATGHGSLASVLSPDTFNEKLLFRKLKDRSNLKKYVTDKEGLKKYVKNKLGEEYVPKTYKVIRSKESLDKASIPNKCCIKPTHLSGPVILRRNGEKVNRRKMKKWFERDRFWWVRENNYKDLERKIIFEELLVGENDIVPNDYKIYCFDGKAKVIYAMKDRFGGRIKKYAFDTNYNFLGFGNSSHIFEEDPPRKPRKLSQMVSLSEELSADFDFIRVDMYEVDSELYVGELTSWPANCQKSFHPEWANKFVGDFFNG